MIIINSGLPASGKSTFANTWTAEDPEWRIRINYDDYRLRLFGKGWKWNGKQEKEMQELAYTDAEKALKSGHAIIIDNCNLSIGSRQRWIDLGKRYDQKVEVHEFNTPIKECVRRDRLRKEGRVGRAVIERMALFNGLINWDDGSIYDTTRPYILVDMDGTLANCSHRRAKLEKKVAWCPRCKVNATTPFQQNGEAVVCDGCGDIYIPRVVKDWDAFYTGIDKDPPIGTIVRLVQELALYSYQVIIVSGRPIDKAGIATEEWLHHNLMANVVHLFMRNGGDFRPDFEVKEEILAKLPKSRIAFVLDDRTQVVNMWRHHGLTCLQVAKGDF